MGNKPEVLGGVIPREMTFFTSNSNTLSFVVAEQHQGVAPAVAPNCSHRNCKGSLHSNLDCCVHSDETTPRHYKHFVNIQNILVSKNLIQ